MSKATVVSIVPFEVRRDMPGVFPGYYSIPPAKDGDFEILHVEDAKCYVYVLDGRGYDRVEPAEQIAKSIAEDFIRDQLAQTEDCHPGIFWVEGHPSKIEIKAKFKKELDKSREVQNNWFKALVRLADDDWQRTHQYRSITDIQRSAANWLNLKRDWIDAVSEDRRICPACGEDVRAGFPICKNCKAILDSEKLKDLKFA